LFTQESYCLQTLESGVRKNEKGERTRRLNESTSDMREVEQENTFFDSFIWRNDL